MHYLSHLAAQFDEDFDILEHLDLFENGRKIAFATTGIAYRCTSYSENAIAGKHGTVKRIESIKRRAQFVEVEYTDNDLETGSSDASIDAMNSRHLFNVLADNHKWAEATYKKGTVYCMGYRIAYHMLGYSIFDKVQRETINNPEFDHNSDFPDPQSVIEFLQMQKDCWEGRAASLAAFRDEHRETVYLLSTKDKQEWENRMIAKGKTYSPIIAINPSESSNAEGFLITNFRETLQEFLLKKISDSVLNKRYRKYCKAKGIQPNNLQCFKLSSAFLLKKISEQDFCEGFESII